MVMERISSGIVLRWPASCRVVVSCGLILVVVLASMTFNYIPKFASNLASTEHAYTTFPGWKRAAFNYEGELILAGLLDKAALVNQTENTLSDPPWVRDYFAGCIELERGNIDEAIFFLKRSSILIHRGGYFLYTGVPLGGALIRTGQVDEATLYLKDALASPFDHVVDKYRAKQLLETISNQ